MKRILSFKNFIILFLTIVTIILTTLAFNNKNKCKEDVKNSNNTYNSNEEYKVLCQREYFFNDTDSYMLTLCDGKLYISKNNEEYKELDLKDAIYSYSFVRLNKTDYYFLTNNGEVYYLSSENIKNETYKLDKLEYKNIVSIKEFYGGSFKEDAYNYNIYAIDDKGNMNKLK